MRHAFGDGTQPAEQAADAEAAQKGRWHFGSSHVSAVLCSNMLNTSCYLNDNSHKRPCLQHRINRSSEMLRDLVLLLLAALALNTFAGGISRAVMILSWM